MIELTHTADGAVTVDVSRLLQAHEQAVRRWARWHVAGWIFVTLSLGAALATGVLALRQDASHQNELRQVRVWLNEAELRSMCWRAAAASWTRIPMSRAEQWVETCVARERLQQRG